MKTFRFFVLFQLLEVALLLISLGCTHDGPGATPPQLTPISVPITACSVDASQKTIYVNEKAQVQWYGTDTTYTITFQWWRSPVSPHSFPSSSAAKEVNSELTCSAFGACDYNYTMTPTTPPKSKACKDPGVHVTTTKFNLRKLWPW